MKDTSELTYNLSNSNLGDLNRFSLGANFKKFNMTVRSFFKNILVNESNSSNLNIYSDFVESSRSLKRTQGVNLPLRLVKYPFGLDSTYDTNYNAETLNLFNLKFNDTETSVKHKTVPQSSYFSIKQKRYTKKGAIPSVTKYLKDGNGNKTKKVRYSGKPILFNNGIFEQNSEDPIVLYRLLKKNKKRNELIPINLARRIIRTKRTLVLPAHINITVVTNSFDIVHS